MIRRVLFAAAVLCVLAAGQPAQAQWGCGGGLGWGGGFGTNYFGYGLPSGWYTGVQGRLPPYFALHPPVYYSGQIIRIPYGCSPFANPWGPGCETMLPIAEPTPAIETAPQSRAIENPFFKPREVTNIPRQADPGLMIENPFYRSDTQLAGDQ